MIGALFEADRAFLLGAGGSDDFGAVELGDLNCGKADAAGGAMDQDPVACFEPAALQQRMIGRVVDVAENCRLLQAHCGGDQIAILGLRITRLREAAEPMAAHHPIAGLEARDAGPDGDDLARAFAARDEGRFRPELVFAGQHQHVDILDAARLDANLQLSGSGRRRVGHLAQCQYLRSAKRFANDRLHRAPPGLLGGLGSDVRLWLGAQLFHYLPVRVARKAVLVKEQHGAIADEEIGRVFEGSRRVV